MKITPQYTLEDLQKLDLQQFHKLWIQDCLTDRQIAKMYNTTKQEVKKKRKELKLNMFNGVLLSVAGGSRYKK